MPEKLELDDGKEASKMEIVRISPEEVKLRKSLRALAGLLPTERIRDLLRLPPMERERAIAQWVRDFIEEHIRTQTALTRKFAEKVRKATEEAKKRETPVGRMIEMQKVRRSWEVIGGPIVIPGAVVEEVMTLPRAVRQELDELADLLERYARTVFPTEIRAEIKAFRKAAETIRSKVGKIRGLVQQLGIDLTRPEIAYPLQQAEIVAADFEYRARQREQWLEEKGRKLTR